MHRIRIVRLRATPADRRLTHAVMDLRYHEGGMEQQTVVPGQQITAMMEFFPAHFVVPAGHEMELVMTHTGRDYLPSAISTPVLVEGAVLKLPVINDDRLFFTPPVGQAWKSPGPEPAQDRSSPGAPRPSGTLPQGPRAAGARGGA